MAHFAKLDDNNVVLAVHVLNNDVIVIDGVESEQAGIDFLADLHGYSNWKQTSYNKSFRKNYAGIGYRYDESLDAFIPPQPYTSWIFNEETCRWDSPIPYPEGNLVYIWNEPTVSWQPVN
jgi:hypothetical protein